MSHSIIPAGAGSGATDLPDLTDVDDAAVPTSGHYLRGDGTDWVNSAILEGDIPAAIARDAEVAAAYQPLSVVGAKVTRTAVQSIPNNAETDISWTSETFDSEAFHDNSTNPQRLTIPTGKGGIYVVAFVGRFATNGTGYRYQYIKKNGTTYEAISYYNPVSADNSGIPVSAILSLAAGDYITAGVFQNSTVALDFQHSLGSHFAAVRLGT